MLSLEILLNSSPVMDRVKKCQIIKIFKCRVITLLRVQIFILPRNHFCKLNFQIFKIKFLTKIWKSSRKMKLLVLNRITRVFSIIYFMIKTRFKLNTITEVVAGAVSDCEMAIFEPRWNTFEKNFHLNRSKNANFEQY